MLYKFSAKLPSSYARTIVTRPVSPLKPRVQRFTGSAAKAKLSALSTISTSPEKCDQFQKSCDPLQKKSDGLQRSYDQPRKGCAQPQQPTTIKQESFSQRFPIFSTSSPFSGNSDQIFPRHRFNGSTGIQVQCKLYYFLSWIMLVF